MKLEPLPLRPDPSHDVDCWVVFCSGGRVFSVPKVSLLDSTGKISKNDARWIIESTRTTEIIYIGSGRCNPWDLIPA